MKKINSLLISLLFSVFLFNSCEKDSEEPSNHFSYNGSSYTVSKGYIKDFGENENGSYDFDIYLVSSTIQYSHSNDEFKGVGDIVYLDLNTSSQNGLVNGTYKYSSERGAFTFVDGKVGINVDMSDDNEDGVTIKIVGGEIEVSIKDNISTLVFDLTTTANKKLTGRFKGTLALM